MRSTKPTLRSLLPDVLAHPVHALLDARPLHRRARLDLPRAVLQPHQSDGFSDFRRPHHVGQILLVGEHQKRHAVQLRIAQQLGQLVARLQQALPVGAVDHVHQDVGVLEVVLPVWADFALAANVPDVQLKAVGHHRFDVKAGGGRDVGDLLAGQLPQQRGFAGIVEAEQQDADLLFGGGAELAQQGEQTLVGEMEIE